jgi:CPA2 family monovalent cation:H+ antiporter-2
VLVWLAVLVVGKTLIVLVVARLFGEPLQTSWRTGLILAHGGEFSLMLLSVSSTSGIVVEEFAGPLFLAIGVSMLAGSLMVRWAGTKA